MPIWSTPQPLFDAINKHFNFVVDLCADGNNRKCKKWLPRKACLKMNWDGQGVGWLNPPFGKEISEYLEKAAMSERLIVACLPGRTNPPWWGDYVMRAKEIRFLRHKQSFIADNGHKGVPPWGVVIAVFDHTHNLPYPVVRSWDWRKEPW